MERHAKRWITGFAVSVLLARGVVAAEEGYVDFRFDNVDVRTFVRVMGEITGKRFIVDEAVKGQVTVEAPRIPAGEAYALAVTILESVGCTVVEGGAAVRVVPLSAGSTPVGAIQGPDKTAAGVGLITRVLALKNVSAAEVKVMLAEVLGADKRNALSVLPTANLIVISGTADLVRRIEEMVEAIDKPGLARVTEVLPMAHASAEDMARQINEAMAVTDTEADRIRQQVTAGGRGLAGVKAVASPQANSLILVGPPAALAELKLLIAKLDVEPPSGRGRLRAIFLKYLTAEDAAKSIKALVSGPAPAAGAVKTAVPLGTIGIEPIAANNALLVDASPRDFEVVEKLVQELDLMPGQVMIEVLIAEVSISSGTDIGVEIASLGLPGKVGDTTLQGVSTLNDDNTALMSAVEKGLFPKGLTVGVAHGTRVAADGSLLNSFPALININAMKKDGRVKILSNIPLLAQNNQEASVSVVNNIPILKSTIQGTGDARDVIQNIERIDVGIKLKLTPHINPDNEVRMLLNPSIEAVIDPGPSGTPFTPTIAKRDVSTTVTVPDGEIIVLSGLIREDSTKVIRKIPLLGDIPLLGFLFRHTVDQLERTNLLIFVRPRLVKKGQLPEVTADLERRSGISSTNQPARIPPEDASR
jgi:general secretion pathway protein D